VPWLLCALLLAAPSLRAAPHPVLDAKGFQPTRDLVNELPFEHIDPMTGNLLLTFTDLVLPGNAGFDLRIQRTYNSKIYETYSNIPGGNTFGEDSWAGIGWILHFGRVLNAGHPTNPGPLEMPDGSQHPLHRHMDNGPTHYITKDLWTYNSAVPAVLRLPNGVTYTFGRYAQVTNTLYVTEIEDPFGNRIEVNYHSNPQLPDVITSVEQHLVGEQSPRIVTFTYLETMPTPQGPQFVGSLDTMTFSGRIWRYKQQLLNPISTYTELFEVKPPLGPPWKFGYEHADPLSLQILDHIETPNGGKLDYVYVPQLFQMGSNFVYSPAITSRQTSGWDVLVGTWTYAYSSSVNSLETEIRSPCGIKTNYLFLGIGPLNLEPWAVGALDTRTTSATAGGLIYETEKLTWVASVPISNIPEGGANKTYVALLDRRQVTRSGRTYTTDYTYAPDAWSPNRPNNFNDYGRPERIDETGELARTTTREFFYGSNGYPGFGTYIVDKIESETVQVGAEVFTRRHTYDAATGFKKSEDIYGIPMSYKADSSGSGNVGRSTDANNHSTSYEYSWGTADRIQTPEYLIERKINLDGTIQWEKRRGLTTSFLYDALMRPTQTTPPLGNPIVTTYDNTAAKYVRVTRGSSQLTTDLDGFGRTSATSNTIPIKTDVKYDVCGRREFESYPYETGTPPGTTYEFDPLGRVTKLTHTPSNDAINYVYSNGVDIDITDEEGRVTRQNWSAFGDPGHARLADVTDAMNVITRYTFNALGKITSVTLPGGGASRSWQYTPRNELFREIHPESGTVTYTYDPAGNLETRSDAAFGTTTFSYDGNNRLTGINRLGSAHDTSIEYDASDNRTALANGDVASEFVYDNANRLQSRKDDLDGVVLRTSYSYDLNDNLLGLTYPSGFKVDYTYDAENRMTSVRKAGSGTIYAQSMQYHPSGALKQYLAGNGILHTFTYDARYRLRTLNTGGASLLRLTYGYDRVSNVTSILDGRIGQFSFTDIDYDPLDRLKKAFGAFGEPEFGYDAKGNRTHKQIGGARTDYTYDLGSQLLVSAEGAENDDFTYDANGNVVENAAGSYTYTPTNMLATASPPSGSPTTSYLYDGDDLRKAKITPAGITYYAHGQGGQLLGEDKATAGALSPVRDYVMAGTRMIAEVTGTLLSASPQSLSFVAVLDKPPPSGKPVAVTSDGPMIGWSAAMSAPWLSVTPRNGVTPATMNVGIRYLGLTEGTHTGTVTITSADAVNSPVTVTVEVTVFATDTLYASPKALSFHEPAGGPDPQPQTAQILYTGGSVPWDATTTEPWISVDPDGGNTTPATISVSVAGQGLAPGTHFGSVTIVSQGIPGSPLTLPVELVIQPAAGQGCAVDASYCEIFDDEPPGPLGAGWIWSEPNVPQVVPDPRNPNAGHAMLLDPPPGKRLNGDVNLTAAHAIAGSEIAMHVMTTGTDPNNPLSLAKIEFYTEPERGWAKTKRTFGTLRFGSNLRFQYGNTLYKMLVNPMQPGRWYAVRVRYAGGQAEVYVDGVLKFSTEAPDADLKLEAFSMTAWDLAPGQAYVDVLESRPGELIVDPMKLDLEYVLLGIANAPTEAPPVPARTSQPAPVAAVPPPSRPEPVRIPVSFEANAGQADPSVRFLGRGPGYLLLVRPTDLIMAIPEQRAKQEPGLRRLAPPQSEKVSLIRMSLRGARSDEPMVALEPQAAQSHYFLARHLAKDRVIHAPRYGRVVSRGVYPGVDLALHGQAGRIEYDLVVAPGADPGQIELEFEGAADLKLGTAGELLITASQGQEIRQPAPVAYQEIGGSRRLIAGRYVRRGSRSVGFEMGAYDRALPLVIDPILSWTLRMGGFHIDEPNDMAADGSAVYVTGTTLSSDFPVLNPLQEELLGSSDAFVAKISDAGNLVYSTFLGGPGGDGGFGIAVDALGEVAVTGSTTGSFPIVNAVPFGPGGGAGDAFVARISADGSQLLNSTMVGGNGADNAWDVGLGAGGDVSLVGSTSSSNFPLEPLPQPGRIGNQDAFVTVVADDFQDLVFSRYLGGNESWGDIAYGVAVAADQSVYVAGFTDSDNFPGATNCAAGIDAFVTRLDAAGTVMASVCHGGSGTETAVGVALSSGVVVVGSTESADFPLVDEIQPFGGQKDAFVAAFSSDLTTVTFSSPLGGPFYDEAGGVSSNGTDSYVTGSASTGFPVVSPMSCGNFFNQYAFVAKFNGGMGIEYSTPLAEQDGFVGHSSVAASANSAFVTWSFQQDVLIAKVLDQTTPGTVQFSTTQDDVSEGGVIWTRVTRTGGEAGTLIVDYATQDGTARSPYDFDGTPGSVVLGDLVCSETIEVQTAADSQGEASETFTLELTDVTGNATIGTPSSLLATIFDDDGGIGAGISAEFTISHRTQPGGPTWEVSVDVPWLTLDQSSGVGPATVTATAKPTGLQPGVYTGRITVEASDATGSPQEILVTFVVTNNLQ
jgi:YD repeat-containing protein